VGQIEIPILDLTSQYEQLKETIQEAILRVVESGQFIMGPDVKQFEQEVAQYLGVNHAIGVNSGTDALFISMRSMGIGPGDEVITTPFTFFATAEAISHVGAKPIFVDIDEHTFNINPDLIEERITERTKAILPVHLYGRPAEMDKIMLVAKKYDLKVIEDCAQSFGACYFPAQGNNNLSSAYAGKKTGTIGDVGAYSFFPSKNLGAYGDGGLIATDDNVVAETARMLRVHGAKKKYYNEAVGYNSRLDTIQAAVLRVKLPHIDTWNNARRKVAQQYNQLFANIAGIITPECIDGHVFHQYTLTIKDKRDTVAQHLRKQGIGSMVYYPVPQDKLPIYQGQYPAYPVSDRFANQVLSLPIWPELTFDKQRRVSQTLLSALE